MHALVMELVEGPTLADRIAQGPIAVEEVLLAVLKAPESQAETKLDKVVLILNFFEELRRVASGRK
jgi:hypothetical protein